MKSICRSASESWSDPHPPRFARHPLPRAERGSPTESSFALPLSRTAGEGGATRQVRALHRRLRLGVVDLDDERLVFDLGFLRFRRGNRVAACKRLIRDERAAAKLHERVLAV